MSDSESTAEPEGTDAEAPAVAAAATPAAESVASVAEPGEVPSPETETPAAELAEAGDTQPAPVVEEHVPAAVDAQPESQPDAQPASPDPALTMAEAAPARPFAHVTVLQPLTSLRDVDLPRRPLPVEDERLLLGTWSAAMERALREERPADAVRLAHVVLRQLPRHLATYYRLIRAAWMLRRWEEGDAWGRRLLRAEPANALAWRAVAIAAEQRGERARAHARWQRAFECDPYEPEIRAGLVRTSVDLARLPILNEACMGSLLLRGFRWDQAAALYRSLTEQDNRRLDFQSGLLVALWQLRAQPEGYELARRLSQSQPYMLLAWAAIDDLGDENDKALARHPLSTMDPDGDYVRMALGLTYSSRQVRLYLSENDKSLYDAVTNRVAA